MVFAVDVEVATDVTVEAAGVEDGAADSQVEVEPLTRGGETAGSWVGPFAEGGMEDEGRKGAEEDEEEEEEEEQDEDEDEDEDEEEAEEEEEGPAEDEETATEAEVVPGGGPAGLGAAEVVSWAVGAEKMELKGRELELGAVRTASMAASTSSGSWQGWAPKARRRAASGDIEGGAQTAESLT